MTLFRSILIIVLFSLVIILGVFWEGPAVADELDDAKVAFGAFDDGLYDFSQQELEKFLRRYPKSKMVERVRLVLLLCSLETGACERAAALFEDLKKTTGMADFGVDSAVLKLRIGNCLLSAGEEKHARKIFKDLIKDYPQSDPALTARFELGRRFFAEKDFAMANQMVTPLLTSLPVTRVRSLQIDRQAVYWLAALSRFELKEFKSCLPLLQEIIGDSENFPLTNQERQDLYAVAIESAWHCHKAEKEILRKWLQIPESELEELKLSAALQLTAEVLHSQSRLAEIRGELIRVVNLDISKEDKIVLYGMLLDIDRNHDLSLKVWLESSIILYPPASVSRIKLLQSLLLLNYRAEDYVGAVAAGGSLLAEDANFWQEERLYFPYLSSLERVGKCDEIVKYVPRFLPPYDETVRAGGRRYTLDIKAGNCLQKLQRFDEAVAFYRSIYAHYRDLLTRVKFLATLYSLAARIGDRQNLEDWISAEVISSFSLDKRENEKLLRNFPELVLLVADHFFKAQAYVKAQPSLLWLENLGLKGGLADRVTFLLAEAYYRCEDLGEALARYQALYEGDSQEFRYLAALRLATIYDAQGYSRKQIKLYQDLLGWESDVDFKAELQLKLKALGE